MRQTASALLLAGTMFLTSLISPAIAKSNSFGESPTLKAVTPISKVLKSPDQYVGKTILVKGAVIDVCPKRGCWLRLSSDQKQQSLTVKVNDGEMVFPVDMRGQQASIQGVLTKEVISVAELIEHEEEKAKAANKPFNPADIKGPKVIYQFKPTGVVFEVE